jgi:hypothetical protein
MTAPAPLGPSIINNHIAKWAPSRHDNTVRCRGDDHRVAGAVDLRGHRPAYLCGDHLPRGLQLGFGWTHLVKLIGASENLPSNKIL